jgi:hypothetical protein
MRGFLEFIPDDLRVELLDKFEEQQTFDQAEYLSCKTIPTY